MVAKIAASIAALFLFTATAAVQQLTPETFTCEKAFGSGFTPHPEFPFACCFPGAVPVPGESRCARPGQDGASGPPNAPPGRPKSVQQPGSNVFDAEGNPGAPGGHCIPFKSTCTLGGAPCCQGTCQGKFPNTVCR